jgi:hypothetical protein
MGICEKVFEATIIITMYVLALLIYKFVGRIFERV